MMGSTIGVMPLSLTCMSQSHDSFCAMRMRTRERMRARASSCGSAATQASDTYGDGAKALAHGARRRARNEGHDGIADPRRLAADSCPHAQLVALGTKRRVNGDGWPTRWSERNHGWGAESVRTIVVWRKTLTIQPTNGRYCRHTGRQWLITGPRRACGLVGDVSGAAA